MNPHPQKNLSKQQAKADKIRKNLSRATEALGLAQANLEGAKGWVLTETRKIKDLEEEISKLEQELKDSVLVEKDSIVMDDGRVNSTKAT